MPVVYITIAKNASIEKPINEILSLVRTAVAEGLDSKSRLLDETHIATRVTYGEREFMLADFELDVFCQKFLRRVFSRDKRANAIAKKISLELGIDVACWINLTNVGYSRFEFKNQESHYAIRQDNDVVKERRKKKETENSDN